MNAGELRDEIKLMRTVTTTSATGAETVSYTTLGTFRAKTGFGKMWRSIVNDQVFYSQSIYFTVRQYADVNDSDIVEWKSKRYRIISIEHKRDEMVKVLTTELIHE